MKYLIGALVFVSFSSFAAGPDCTDAISKTVAQVKATTFKNHELAPQATVERTTQDLYLNGKFVAEYYVEWVDHTVAGDAYITIDFDPSDCSIIRIQADAL